MGEKPAMAIILFHKRATTPFWTHALISLIKRSIYSICIGDKALYQLLHSYILAYVLKCSGFLN
jgi:hypothetical protein